MAPERFIVTPIIDHRGRRTFSVWEYDLTRPRLLTAADRRMHYAAKAHIGTFTTEKAANDAIELLSPTPIEQEG